jgi:dipeptidase E
VTTPQLFLASTTAGLEIWLNGLPRRPQRALFIPTAANPLSENGFVELTSQTVLDAGIRITTVDLAETRPEETRSAVEAADLVVVGGGYAIYLLEHALRTQFDRVVTGRVAGGDLAYAGISAGAALAGPDLTSFADAQDPGHVKTFTGLGLVPFVVLPHRNRGQAERHDALGAGGQNLLFSLDDDQAVWVSGSTIRVTTTPPTR